MTGINPFILIGILLLAIVGLVVIPIMGARPKKQRTASEEQRCLFIRENGTRCIREKVSSTTLCKHHTIYVERYGTKPVRKEVATIGSVRVKRSQCGFIKDDGSKCKKLKPVSIQRCDYHLRLENGVGNRAAS
ncbi:hypothetical protein [Sphingomonas faeni]|uniref:hypothetical protein n=1 Tax=Sphingomonas faeni TaxID=185950 RepID=UPI0011B1CBA8|nr:hypothetical protein [Sphingomonas faeni]